jgi:hypothetical protein
VGSNQQRRTAKLRTACSHSFSLIRIGTELERVTRLASKPMRASARAHGRAATLRKRSERKPGGHLSPLPRKRYKRTVNAPPSLQSTTAILCARLPEPNSTMTCSPCQRRPSVLSRSSKLRRNRFVPRIVGPSLATVHSSPDLLYSEPSTHSCGSSSSPLSPSLSLSLSLCSPCPSPSLSLSTSFDIGLATERLNVAGDGRRRD